VNIIFMYMGPFCRIFQGPRENISIYIYRERERERERDVRLQRPFWTAIVQTIPVKEKNSL